jgi:rhomboid protease GluP
MSAFGKRNVGATRAAFAPSSGKVLSPSPAKPSETSASSPTTSTSRIPYLSLAIFVLLCTVYGSEIAFDLNNTWGILAPSRNTVIALGGLSGRMVGLGEWWRLFTGPLLHPNLVLLVVSGLLLFLAGYFLEPLVGRRWFAAIYVVGSLGGALGSILLDAPGTIVVGASGAIMGLLGATLVCSFSDAMSEKRARYMRAIARRWLLISLVPLAARMQADYFAHLGGAVAGGLAGFVLQIFWSEENNRPSHAGIALTFAASAAAVSLLSFFLVLQAFPLWAWRGDDTFPDAMFSARDADRIAKSAALVARYPYDPRANFYRALYYLEADDRVDAEKQLRIALLDRPALDLQPTPDFGKVLQIYLAATLISEGRTEEAKVLSPADCEYASGRVDLEDVLATLRKAGVCT